MCGMAIEALDSGNGTLDIWGDTSQTRSFCTSINNLVNVFDQCNTDTFIRNVLNWGQHIPRQTGMEKTYAWTQLYAHQKAGEARWGLT